jgi:Uma2 family endonuclease
MAVQFRPRTVPTDEELEYLNAHNAPLRFERTLDGELLVMPPTGYETGLQNTKLVGQLREWNRRYGHGKVIGSSTGISIGLNGAPDAGWLSGARDKFIPNEARAKFLSIAPELIFELISPSDTVPAVAKRAGEWVAAGVQFAVVLNPAARNAVVHDDTGAGDPVRNALTLAKSLLPGADEDLVLDLEAISTRARVRERPARRPSRRSSGSGRGIRRSSGRIPESLTAAPR